MRQGSLELAFLGISFLALQAWWIGITIKNRQNKKLIDNNLDQLAVMKKRLEDLLKK